MWCRAAFQALQSAESSNQLRVPFQPSAPISVQNSPSVWPGAEEPAKPFPQLIGAPFELSIRIGSTVGPGAGEPFKPFN